MNAEEWRPVVGYEGLYEVSDAGHVRSLPRPIRGAQDSIRMMHGRELKPWTTGSPHLVVSLWRDNTSKRVKVHHLVLQAFVGPCPDGMVGCHYDDNPTNNHLSNLRWDTLSANQFDMVRNGLHYNAKKTHCPQGHPYNAENTFNGGHPGGRQCRTCQRATGARQRHYGDRAAVRRYPCDRCDAIAGEWCRGASGTVVIEHRVRRSLAAQAGGNV